MDNFEHNESNFLTLYYSKATGRVALYCSTRQTMDYFGDLKEDYSNIYDYIHVSYDKDIINNFKEYRVIEGKLISEKDRIVKLEEENKDIKESIKNITQVILEQGGI